MKKLLALLMAIIMCFSMAGCGTNDALTGKAEKEVFSPEDFIRNAADFLSVLEDSEEEISSSEGNTSNLALTLSATDAGKEFLTSAFDLQPEMINWLESVCLDFNVAAKDNQASIGLAALLNNVNLLSLDAVIDNDSIYLSIPEYSSTALKFVLPGMSEATSSNVFEIIDTALLQDVLDKYLDIVADNVEFESESTNKTAGNASTELTEHKLILDSNLLYKLWEEIIPVMQEDKNLETLIHQFADYYNMTEASSADYYYISGDELYSMFTEWLDDAEEELDYADYDEEDNYESGYFSLYSNSEERFAGFIFNIEEGESVIEFLNLCDGDDYGIEFTINEFGSTLFGVYINGVKNGDVLDADVSLWAEGEELYTFYITISDFENTEEGTLCAEAEFPIPGAPVEENLSIYAKIDDENDDVSVSLLGDGNALFNLDFITGESTPGAEIAVPTEFIDSDNQEEFYNWGYMFGFNFVMSLTPKLKEANVPQEIITSILGVS